MLPPGSQQLRITLRQASCSEHDEVLTVIHSDMRDAHIHAWFELFARVLASAGFCEKSIMRGGCQLAFNEYRRVDMMREVAEEYDLSLSEDIVDPAPSAPAKLTIARP